MKNFLFLFVLLIFACASPQKNFEKGNFRKAFEGAINELEDGKRGKNKDILNSSFREMLKQHLTDYELLMRSSDLEKWELAYLEREELLVNYIKGKRWLNSSFDEQLDTLDSEQNQLAIDIASGYKSLGDEAITAFKSTGNKLAAQDAHGFYLKVLDYDPNDSETLDAVDFALQQGTIHILVEADSWDFSNEWEIDRRFKSLERESKGYYQIYFEEIIANPDCRIEIDFNRLDVNKSQRTETEEFRKEIQDGYTTVRDTSGNTVKEPKYIEVIGSVSTTVETYKYFWEVRAQADRLSNYCDFRSRTFNTDYVAERRFYNLRGDKRAIPSSYYEGEDKTLRYDEDEVREDMIDNIYRQILNHFF